MTKINHNIIGIRASHDGQILRFEPAIQDRRLYYRLLVNERGAGVLTDEVHALQTIKYWRNQGWITLPCECCSEPSGDGNALCPACAESR